MLYLYSSRVVSWAFSNQPNSELSTRALTMAVQHRRPDTSASTQALLFHSYQEVQYSSDTFQQSLRNHNIPASMSRRGYCLDNTVTERFLEV